MRKRRNRRVGWLGVALATLAVVLAVPSPASAQADPGDEIDPDEEVESAAANNCPWTGTGSFRNTIGSEYWGQNVGLIGHDPTANSALATETFYLKCHNSTWAYPYTLWSVSDGGFVNVEAGYTGTWWSLLRVGSTTATKKSLFRLNCWDLDGYSLRCTLQSRANQRYVTVEGSSPRQGALRARATTAHAWERLRITFH